MSLTLGELFARRCGNREVPGTLRCDLVCHATCSFTPVIVSGETTLTFTKTCVSMLPEMPHHAPTAPTAKPRDNTIHSSTTTDQTLGRAFGACGLMNFSSEARNPSSRAWSSQDIFFTEDQPINFGSSFRVSRIRPPLRSREAMEAPGGGRRRVRTEMFLKAWHTMQMDARWRR